MAWGVAACLTPFGQLVGGHRYSRLEALGEASPEERHQLLNMMLDAVYVDMAQGLVLGPKPKFLPLFNLGEPVTTGDSELVTGGRARVRLPINNNLSHSAYLVEPSDD